MRPSRCSGRDAPQICSQLLNLEGRQPRDADRARYLAAGQDDDCATKRCAVVSRRIARAAIAIALSIGASSDCCDTVRSMVNLT
jgi:hypothetical protein